MEELSVTHIDSEEFLVKFKYKNRVFHIVYDDEETDFIFCQGRTVLEIFYFDLLLNLDEYL